MGASRTCRPVTVLEEVRNLLSRGIESIRVKHHDSGYRRVEYMTETVLDLREVPPSERHPQIHDAFDRLEPGETLTIVNDHEPKPLFYELQAEVPAFDAENYSVEQRGETEFVAELPKRND